MAGTEIYSDLDEGSTICGRIIKIGEAQQSRFATLGGVIKYVFCSPSGSIRGVEACLGSFSSLDVFKISLLPFKRLY